MLHLCYNNNRSTDRGEKDMFVVPAGVLAHVTSLPRRTAWAIMGKTARDFVDFHGAAHQTYWQVLPLGHTGFGDSPYQCFRQRQAIRI